MNTNAIASALCGALAFAQITIAQDLPPPEPVPEAAAPALAPAQTPAPVVEPATTPVDRSRYRRHQGRWWYLMPDGRWKYWHGDHWEDYVSPPPVDEAVVATVPRQTVYYRAPTTAYYSSSQYSGYPYSGYSYSSYPYYSGYRGYYPSFGLYLGGGIHHHGGHWGHGHGGFIGHGHGGHWGHGHVGHGHGGHGHGGHGHGGHGHGGHGHH